MKLIVSSSELLKSTLTVYKAVPAKASEAILEDFLFSLEGDKLTITASDKEITLLAEIDVIQSIEEGKIAVPARQITELLRELPDQPITISTKNNNSFECEWSNGFSTLPYFNPDDYPVNQTTNENAITINMDINTLINGISSTIYACSTDEAKAVMNTIFFEIKSESTTMVASDLQKLICYTIEDIKADREVSFLLHKKHAAVLKSILPKEDASVSICFDEKIVVCKYDNITVICCRVLGNYPDYTAIIPKDNSNILKINRALFLNIVKRIAVCSPKASNHIKFDLTAGNLEVSAQDTGFELAAHEKIDCSYEGDDLVIGFKSTHLIEILSNLSCEEIVMRFADKRRSALITPAPEEEDKEKVFAIIMPIMVK